MKKTEFYPYVALNGRNEVKDYLNQLPKKDLYKVIFVINAIENIGLPYALTTKYTKHLVSYKGLYEVRSRLGHRQERILYCQSIGNRYYLLWGFTKEKPQDMKKALKHADKLRNELLRRLNHD